MKPAEQEGIHELLPWYVAGTLEAREASSFREHLVECASCRRELRVVEELRDQLERHGRAWIEDHPAPETLVAVVRRSAVDEVEAERVRRHLELCDACALEASWIRGDSITVEDGQAVPLARATGRWRRVAWPALAAAAGLLVGLLLPFGNSEPVGGLDLVVPTLVVAPLRGSPEVQQVQLRPGQRFAVLHVELDFSPDAFPLALEILDERGAIVERKERIAPEDLYQGANLFPRLPARAGRYSARIVSSNRAYPPLVIPFELVGPASAR